MGWQRNFTRPVMARCAGNSAALVAFMCDRAEDDPQLARQILGALAEMQHALHLDVTGTPEPSIQK